MPFTTIMSSFQSPNAALPSSALPNLKKPKSPLFITSHHKNLHFNQKLRGIITTKLQNLNDVKKLSLAVQLTALFAAVEQPALAITGENYEDDLVSILIQVAIIAFGYFIVAPPIIMNWLRVRWYRRKLLEMYLQFMFVFIFYPGIFLWAPFLNFRKFPRDPDMKYPWSTPQDPNKIPNDFLKYPWTTSPEEYE